MKQYVLLSYLLLLVTTSFCQQDSTRSLGQEPYRVSLPVEGTGSVLFIGVSAVGFRKLDALASFDKHDLAGLDPHQVNAFDRPGLFYNPALFERAQKRSDLFLNLSLISPLLLLADKHIRNDWLDVLTLYVVTHAVDNAVYFAAAYSVRRARPLTYYTTIPEELRIGEAKSNSFYSGHVSFSSTATFFLAKVFTDYRLINGWKRIAIFSLASLPPILVGINRMEAGKHFRTDVLLGFTVGAACGILIPEVHKRAKAAKTLRFIPYFTGPGPAGFIVRYTF